MGHAVTREYVVDRWMMQESEPELREALAGAILYDHTGQPLPDWLQPLALYDSWGAAIVQADEAKEQSTVDQRALALLAWKCGDEVVGWALSEGRKDVTDLRAREAGGGPTP